MDHDDAHRRDRARERRRSSPPPTAVDSDARVPSCPDWTVDDLLRPPRHRAAVGRRAWSSGAPTGAGPRAEVEPPADRDALLEWVRAGSAGPRCGAARRRRPTPSCGRSRVRATARVLVRVVRRTRSRCTGSTRSSRPACGGPLDPIDSELACDGIDEFFDVIVPFRLRDRLVGKRRDVPLPPHRRRRRVAGPAHARRSGDRARAREGRRRGARRRVRPAARAARSRRARRRRGVRRRGADRPLARTRVDLTHADAASAAGEDVFLVVARPFPVRDPLETRGRRCCVVIPKGRAGRQTASAEGAGTCEHSSIHRRRSAGVRPGGAEGSVAEVAASLAERFADDATVITAIGSAHRRAGRRPAASRCVGPVRLHRAKVTVRLVADPGAVSRSRSSRGPARECELLVRPTRRPPWVEDAYFAAVLSVLEALAGRDRRDA